MSKEASVNDVNETGSILREDSVGQKQLEPKAQDELPSFPVPRDYSGKLPDEFVKNFLKDIESFKKTWAECSSFDIQIPYLVELAWSEPFLGSLSRRIAKIKTASIPTAGVCVKNNAIEMFWNPIFFAKSLTHEQVPGVIKHELYHVVFEHITARRQLPHVLWNAATDCAINSLIPRRELPDGLLIPGEMFTPPNPPKDWKPGILARIIKECPKEQSSEWYMAKFLQDEEVQQAMARAKAKAKSKAQKGQDPGGSSGQCQDDGDGDDQNDPQSKQRDFEDALRDELYGDGSGQFDDHDMWDQLDDGQRDMMRDAIRDMFRDCIRDAESRSNGWGSVPSSIQQHLKKLVSKEVDWRELINNFIGRSRSTQTTSSIKRINRRFPWEHPGRKRTYSAKPAIAFDQSGSMSDEWVTLLFAEVSNLGSLTEYDVIPFDHTVDEKNIQTIRRGGQPNIVRTRQGGTDFDAPVRYVNEHKGKYDCVILLTDAGCSKPIRCDVPLAYIITPGCEMPFEPDPDNIVIRMSDTRKK